MNLQLLHKTKTCYIYLSICLSIAIIKYFKIKWQVTEYEVVEYLLKYFLFDLKRTVVPSEP